ncbi:hypothetical protein J0H33_15850 [bacterium]|nr:hypothetical protein [bacterium]
MLLVIAEWLFFLLVVAAAVGSAAVLVAGGGLGVAACRLRVKDGAWPPWAGRLGAALANAATIAAPVGGWIAHVAGR